MSLTLTSYKRRQATRICRKLPNQGVFLIMEHTFCITETGDVYRRDPHDWVLLGALPSVLNDPSVIGREVRNWWKSLVESDQPLPLLLLRNSKLRGPQIPSSDAMIVSGFEEERVAAAGAADIRSNTQNGGGL
jgi:hypothetical protein